jgi:hypothetical protein
MHPLVYIIFLALEMLLLGGFISLASIKLLHDFSLDWYVIVMVMFLDYRSYKAIWFLECCSSRNLVGCSYHESMTGIRLLLFSCMVLYMRIHVVVMRCSLFCYSNGVAMSLLSLRVMFYRLFKRDFDWISTALSKGGERVDDMISNNSFLVVCDYL